MWLKWDLNSIQTVHRTAAELHSRHPALLSLKGMLGSAMHLPTLLNELQQVFCSSLLHLTGEKFHKVLSAQAKHM